MKHNTGKYYDSHLANKNFDSGLTFSPTHHCAWPTIQYSVCPAVTKSEFKLRMKGKGVVMRNSKYQMLIPSSSVTTTKFWGGNLLCYRLREVASFKSGE